MASTNRSWSVIIGFLITLPLTAIQASGGDEHRKAPPDPMYVQECGSCHAPYPAKLLSADSWQTLMKGLEKHFGSDASLDDKSVASAIQAYLLSQARRKETLDESGHPILRITETRWFRHEHAEVPSSVWRSPAVKRKAPCAYPLDTLTE